MKVGRSEHPNQRGLLSTELAILMPVLVVIAVLAVYVVQVERHASRTQQAADAAARAASLTRSEHEARSAAQTAAESVCSGPVLIDDASFVYVPPQESSFTPGSVTVHLICTEQFSGFAPLVNDQARRASGVAIAVIEYWRSTP